MDGPGKPTEREQAAIKVAAEIGASDGYKGLVVQKFADDQGISVQFAWELIRDAMVYLRNNQE